MTQQRITCSMKFKKAWETVAGVLYYMSAAFCVAMLIVEIFN